MNRAPLGRADVHVWLAPESLAVDAASAAWLADLLSEEERAANARFAADSPRRLHLVARALQRTALSQYEPGIAPRDWRFVRGEAGRPSPEPGHGTDLDFNLAHTRGLVVLAVGRATRLGVDVEGFARRRSLDLARRYFSPREIAALEALPAEAQHRRFLELWTLKEAYLKAIGTGIAGGLGTMTFDWRGGDVTFERAADPDAARWHFAQRDLGEHLLALAWRSPDTGRPNVTFRDFAPGQPRLR